MGPDEKRLRRELRRDAMRVNPPEKIWTNISRQLDEEQVTGRSPVAGRGLTLVKQQPRPACRRHPLGVALGMVAVASVVLATALPFARGGDQTPSPASAVAARAPGSGHEAGFSGLRLQIDYSGAEGPRGLAVSVVGDLGARMTMHVQ